MKKIEKEQVRKIPFKNYLLLILIGTFTIAVTLYINAWIKSYNTHKISVSPLSGNVSEINIDEMNVSLSETRDVILYVSYTNDKTIYSSESKLFSKLKKENMLDYLIYLNVTDYLEDNEYINILKNKFPSISSDLVKAPLFIYFRNGEPVSVINSTGKIVDNSDFSQIIETYEIED